MKTLLTVILLTLSLGANAGGFSNQKDAKAFSDKVMQYFLKANFDEGLNMVKPYWPLPVVEIDGLSNTIKQQWPVVEQRFGRATGIEYLRSEKIGSSFLRLYYLHKFENHAIYWRFDFYKPEKEWKINSIVFLDDLNTLYR